MKITSMIHQNTNKFSCKKYSYIFDNQNKTIFSYKASPILTSLAFEDNQILRHKLIFKKFFNKRETKDTSQVIFSSQHWIFSKIKSN